MNDVSLKSLEASGFNFSKVQRSTNGVTTIKVVEDRLSFLSGMIHMKQKRCGGFATYESESDALRSVNNIPENNALRTVDPVGYELKFQDKVPALTAQVEAKNIEATIRHLSSYHNRYYKSETGVESMEWIKKTWKSLGAGRNDVTVEEFKHSWDQPSIIMTVEGNSKKDEVIVIGGHGDSINGYFLAKMNRAPGADDNASGISTITEIIRILMASSFKPERTIKFMAYAAEEVGLRGSKDIAKQFAKDKVDVKGVIQLDMTNFNGSEKKIYLMDDFTNKGQNEFIGNLINQYVGVTWGYSRCGYACSDHASWHGERF